MALPSSGSISMSQINSQLGRPSTATISLDTAENGGYGAINTCGSPFPSATNPASMSEWRGYNHNASCFRPFLHNSSISGDAATTCNIGGYNTTWFHDGPNEYPTIGNRVYFLAASWAFYAFNGGWLGMANGVAIQGDSNGFVIAIASCFNQV